MKLNKDENDIVKEIQDALDRAKRQLEVVERGAARLQKINTDAGNAEGANDAYRFMAEAMKVGAEVHILHALGASFLLKDYDDGGIVVLGGGGGRRRP
jgi:hypothetical protein